MNPKFWLIGLVGLVLTACPTPSTTPPPSGNSAVQGNLFFDANKNGIKEAGEKPRGGFVVWIDSNNNGSPDAGERKTTTDTSGNYSIGGVAAGTYNLRHELPVGYASSLALSGNRLNQQIVGGTNAPAGKWNSIVAMLLSNRSDPFQAQVCGGNLIAPDWILTAAHCVVEQGVVSTPSSLQIAIGFTRLENPLARVDISQIIVHPNYVEQTFDNDIALLKLSSQLDNPTLRPILPSEAALAASGVTASIVGWGGLNQQLVNNNNIAQNFPKDLQEATVPIAGCGQVTSSTTANMFCAGGQNIDTCQGDSGGPMYVFDQGVLRQAGIVSWGAGCAQAGFPGVYTKLLNFDAWLVQQMGRGTAPNQSITLAAGETKTQNFAVRTQ
jgi:secreted trypsin-like serine protease